MHLHRVGFAIDADLRHFDDVTSKGFDDRDAAVTPGGKRLAPSGFVCGEFEDGAMPRSVGEELAAKFEGIFPAGLGYFINKTPRDVAVLRISDGAPEALQLYRPRSKHNRSKNWGCCTSVPKDPRRNYCRDHF
jgi:hypothetical protein